MLSKRQLRDKNKQKSLSVVFISHASLVYIVIEVYQFKYSN